MVHGNIQDADGVKFSKSLGNVIDPIEQVDKYGLDAVRYYLVFGLNTFSDSKYSEIDLVQKWNNDIVNGLGNLISRVLHLIDIKNVVLDETTLNKNLVEKIQNNSDEINKKFEECNLKEVGILLNVIVSNLNKRITVEKPFDKDCENYSEILNELYFELKDIIVFFGIIIKNHKDQLDKAFVENKKIIIFERI